MLNEVESFIANIRELEARGLTLRHKHVGAVRVGDYILYEKRRIEPNAEGRARDFMSKECGRVCATGGEQGSGPNPTRTWVAVEGDDQIQQYTHETYVLVLEPAAVEAEKPDDA